MFREIIRGIVLGLGISLCLCGVTSGQGKAADLVRAQEILEGLRDQGNFSDETKLDEQLIKALREELGPEHAITLNVMANAAVKLFQHGDYAMAKTLLEKVLSTRRRLQGEEHPDTLITMHNLGAALWKQGDFTVARKFLEEVLATRMSTLGEKHAATLSTMAGLATILHEQGDPHQAREMMEEILATQQRVLGAEHSDTLISMASLALFYSTLGYLHQARELQEEVLAIQRLVLGTEHPDTLMSMANLAGTLKAQGDWNRAREMEEELLATNREVLGAEHPDTLRSMVYLATTLRMQDDFRRSRELEEEALATFRRILGTEHPDSLKTYSNLASTLFEQGEFEQARDMEEEVLASFRRMLGAEHPDTLTAMSNLAGTLYELGDFSRARQLLEDLLAARRQLLGPEHPGTLTAMANLASTLRAQGDLNRARKMEEEELATVRRVLGAEHPETLKSIDNLARTLHQQGNFNRAQVLFEEVLATRRRVLGPEHTHTLDSMSNLAQTLGELGDLKRERELEERVLTTSREVLGKEHPATLSTMHNLAGTLYHQKDLDGARRLFEKLIRIRQSVLGSEHRPNTLGEASTFHYLALIYHDLKKPEQAVVHFFQTLDALESQTARAGDSEDFKSSFKARFEGAYRDAVTTLLYLGRLDDAHHVLERFRNQETLKMLAKREIVLAEMPPDLEERRYQIDRTYDATTWQRDKLDPVRQKDAFNAILEKQRNLRRQRELLQVEIRRRFPDLAAVQAPRPLTVSEIRQVLDPGTLMLSYMVGPERTSLFILSHDREIEVHELDIDARTLWRQLRRWYTPLADGTAEDAKASLSSLAIWLYDNLITRVVERIDNSERLLVIADGPLHYLPFAALVRPDGSHLIEKIPVHTVTSATVYAHLLKRRNRTEIGEPMQIAAFGHPLYPQDGAQGNVTVRAAVERGLLKGGLQPLPFTEREVNEIAKLFPEPSVRTFLQDEATEENARSIGKGIRVLHIAAHGVMDRFTPLDSFIALSIPKDPEGFVENGGHNGLLQAWELFELVRFDADLVVLSACVTAFGKERGGEGLLSLSRAFQVAGARTVVASLWNVQDESTAELMIRFYTHLRDGRSTAEALRAAQLSFIRGEGVPEAWRSPYHWAGFQVIGDWK